MLVRLGAGVVGHEMALSDFQGEGVLSPDFSRIAYVEYTADGTPQHAYTRELLRASLGYDRERARAAEL